MKELHNQDAVDALTAAFARLQQPLPLSKDTLLDAVADLFRAHPNKWIDAHELQRVGGAFAWRTRVSDVRKRYGWVIENRTSRGKDAAGHVWTVSEYRRVVEKAA